MKGFINVIKPEGLNSTKVVNGVKKKFGVPCGHMGTLDPMASGVLPVGIGKTSRLFDYLLKKDKTYIAEFRFGVTSDTLDITGKTFEETSVIPTEQTVRENLGFFVGDISQIPPKYSAKNVDGKKGYALARKGVEFELAPSKVTINRFDIAEKISDTDYRFIIDCKGGTYIRSLARDLGERCGSLALMTKLERIKSGAFSLGNGVPFDEFMDSDNPEKYILPADMAVDFPKISLSVEKATRILNGLFDDYGYPDGFYRVYCRDDFWGIGVSENGILKIKSYVR